MTQLQQDVVDAYHKLLTPGDPFGVVALKAISIELGRDVTAECVEVSAQNHHGGKVRTYKYEVGKWLYLKIEE